MVFDELVTGTRVQQYTVQRFDEPPVARVVKELTEAPRTPTGRAWHDARSSSSASSHLG